MIKVSAVVPCYNEVEVIEVLYDRLSKACQATVPDSYEIVLIDDGSSDGTRDSIRALQKRDSRVVGVFLSRNHGHQLALTAGLSEARGDRIFVLDADLQDPPELLAQMMEEMDKGADVVFGQRESRSGETAFKKASAFLFYRMLNRIVEIEIPMDTGDFRLMSRRIADLLAAMPERQRFVRGMVSWLGYKQVSVTYQRDPRLAGETKYPLKRMILFALDAVTSFSVLPLRVATWLGFTFAAAAMVYGVFVLFRWTAGETIQGWTSLTLIVLLLGSVQLVVMGILGEYLGRQYIEAKSRPIFIIEEVQRNDVSPQQDAQTAVIDAKT